MGISVEPPGPADPLTPQASAVVYGTVTSATALETIVTTAALPAGIYSVSMLTAEGGAPASPADRDNYQLLVNATVISTMITEPAANVANNLGPFNVTVPAAGTISVQAIGIATVGAVYRILLTATKVG
jgi:hypothetical protein